MRRTALWTLLVLGACSHELAPSAPLLDEIATLDPCFGGRPVVEAWMRDSLNLTWPPKVDPEQQARARQHHADAEHRRACARVGESIACGIDSRVAEYLRSPAGRAAARAQQAAIAGSLADNLAFLQGLQLLRDPDRVGAAAKAAMSTYLLELVRGGETHALSEVPWIQGARHVTPAHAREIDRFYRSEVGQRWLRVQQLAFTRSEASRRELLGALCAGGWARSR